MCREEPSIICTDPTKYADEWYTLNENRLEQAANYSEMEAAALDSNPSSYEIKSELSSCCFGIGIVYLARHVPTQQFVAVKKFQMDKAKEETNLIRVCVGGVFPLATQFTRVYL